jgi:hypothetical protein
MDITYDPCKFSLDNTFNGVANLQRFAYKRRGQCRTNNITVFADYVLQQ